jgi:hypothetical protein
MPADGGQHVAGPVLNPIRFLAADGGYMVS